MLQVEIIDGEGAKRIVQVPDDCVIGKGAQNEIRLDSWRLGKEHARLFNTQSGVLIEDMGAFSGVQVNGRRIDTQYGPLRESDVIGIGSFQLSVAAIRASSAQSISTSATTSDRGHESNERSQIALPSATRKQQQQKNGAPFKQPIAGSREGPAAGLSLILTPDQRFKELEFEWRTRIHAKLLDTMDLRRRDVSRMSDEHLRSETETLIRQLLAELDAQIPAELDRDLLCTQVLNEAVGLGPLEELLVDDDVSEIMVNRYDEIYVERAGRLQKHTLTFTGDRAVMGVIERIVAPLGRRIDESSPMVDARLKDGSRVNAIIPPLALKGATLTIRKFPKHKLTVRDLVRYGSVDAGMAEFLKLCVEARKNIIVSGGTGSGKTTLLNILSNFIPSGERIITVEDAAELTLHHEHLIGLESRPPNVEGKGAVPIRDLVRNTLRMRPDRIVIGECRGAEALDMLQAMNTGHEGSLTTLHANSPRDALARLETMVLMAGMELPLVAIREQVASAVDIIVQQTRFSCGTRVVTHIVELTGMEGGKVQLQELFKFVHKGFSAAQGKVLGYFTGCDIIPNFYDDLRAAGGALDVRIFKPASPEQMDAQGASMHEADV